MSKKFYIKQTKNNKINNNQDQQYFDNIMNGLIKNKTLKTMESEFIPYQQALDLKELGFDEPCVAHFTKDHPTDKPYVIIWEDKSKKQDVNKMSGFGLCLAPLYQQAFKFFREEHKLSCSIELTDNSRHYYFYFTISDSKNRDYNDEDCFDSCRKTYDNRKYGKHEEAELGALKKLIEIVKNK